ncbi:SDR family NAD(P)-dependent oxidoreductase [Terrimonas pollutisoli]|uniref:SDR family NAD(P)-dependent oxidoreductase n=1 Tax=Terrimonas pollutisoli TaxID=3034147 RepID=UPI0023EBDE95|nr:SDR family NAD(P)-dependent oxidoreductase [Terrimonas sp. H1YJ31]
MQTAIVTGASGNLGQAVVKKFIENGFHVTGTILHNDASVMDFPTDRFEAKVVDLSSEAGAATFVQSVLEKNKSVDAAVLTVGGFAAGKIVDTPTADILKQYQLNFETAYNIARPVFTQMLLQGYGRIFLIGSRPGLDAKSGKGMVAYGLAKSLIFRLAELMNDEAKGHNVVTNVIVPSTIDTPQNRKSMPDANFDNWVKAEDIADIISYYCSAEAKTLREPIIKVYGNA